MGTSTYTCCATTASVTLRDIHRRQEPGPPPPAPRPGQLVCFPAWTELSWTCRVNDITQPTALREQVLSFVSFLQAQPLKHFGKQPFYR